MVDEFFFVPIIDPMKLTDWLTEAQERPSAFAARLRTSPGYIADLCKGKQPSLRMAQRIMEATKGAVRPEDFFYTLYNED